MRKMKFNIFDRNAESKFRKRDGTMEEKKTKISMRMGSKDLKALDQLVELEKAENDSATRSSVIIDAVRTYYALNMNDYANNDYLKVVQSVITNVLDNMYKVNEENLQTAYKKTNEILKKQNEKLWYALKLLLSETDFAESSTANALAIDNNYIFEQYIFDKINHK